MLEIRYMIFIPDPNSLQTRKNLKKYVLVEIEISENDNTQWKASNIA